ncbi:SLC13 family permease [Evansella sp. AB-P1]|uniref:SLC13 family permease n=1 Tax=Evansella sp. AB-P1 TaxID=3037653 RepID=UPI00241D9B54|nr:SLC13 family permease [Evansella sp. AB-P1]MDG5787205.1 SLC13 family permease [Evansella sp. AB-P1]
MTIDMVIVMVVLFFMFVCLVKDFFRPDFIVFCALAIFLFAGILTPAEALKGFSNEGMLTVGLLFIIAGAIQQSNFLFHFIQLLLGKGMKTTGVLMKMMFPVAGFSAFLNNTPIVVMLTPVVKKWCEKYNLSPSKLLLPLSYAAIFGGTITLIGTSTNLLVHGLMLDLGMPGFSMFQLAIVAIPACVLGILYMSTLGHRILPSTKSIKETFTENKKEYFAEAYIEASFPHIGKSIKEAGLRNLEGVYLVEIIRDRERIYPVTSRQKIRAHDTLIFTGVISTIFQLENMQGLRLETGSELNLNDVKNGNYNLVEAVVSHHSTLIYKSVKENQFRSKFDAAVIAVHRNQERIQSKIGNIMLKPGDSLLLLAGDDFIKRGENTNDFYIISTVENIPVNQPKKAYLSILVLLCIVLLATFNILSIFKAAVLGVIALVLSKTVSLDQAKNFVHFDVLLLIASSIGIGVAMDKTGTAFFLANYLIQFTQFFGIIGAVAGVYLLTAIFTEMITNNAAVVMMFPIAFATATHLSVDPFGFFVAIAIAASASFMTPIGYQTNLIVYGPGRYRFSDYLKAGFPLSIIYFLLTITIVYHTWI